MYQQRMFGYYPQVIQSIYEFQAIIDGEYPEFEDLADSKDRVVEDAYLLTMNEDRVEQWENILGITPLLGSSIQDRRETIIARIKGQGKLNTELINNIVHTFTGGTAKSWVEDSVLYVEIEPPPGNKLYKFENVENELSLKVPAHLGFKVGRMYWVWDEVKEETESWKELRALYKTWEDVKFHNKSLPNQLDITTLDQFYLG